jgi:hypothetical protein
MKLELRIRADNLAFGETENKRDPDRLAELARLLRVAANALEAGTTGAPLFDFNGNRVGRFDLSED